MYLVEALTAILQGLPGYGALYGDYYGGGELSVYWIHLPQEPTYPAVTIEWLDRDPDNAVSSIPALTWSTVRIKTWDETYGAAYALAMDVEMLLNGQAISRQDHSHLRSILALGLQDDYAAEIPVYALQQDYHIAHEYALTTYATTAASLTATAVVPAATLTQFRSLQAAAVQGQVSFAPVTAILLRPLMAATLETAAYMPAASVSIRPDLEIAFALTVAADAEMHIAAVEETAFTLEIFDDGAP